MSNQNYWNEIVNVLIERGLTVATMESCTGGGVANVITNVSGASAILSESYVTYSNEAKIKQGVRASVVEKHTVYSMETAVEMAKVVRSRANTDFGIGVTGQLGRIDPNNPVNTLNIVWFAIVTPKMVHARNIRVPDFERMEQKDYVINSIARAFLEILN